VMSPCELGRKKDGRKWRNGLLHDEMHAFACEIRRKKLGRKTEEKWKKRCLIELQKKSSNHKICLSTMVPTDVYNEPHLLTMEERWKKRGRKLEEKTVFQVSSRNLPDNYIFCLSGRKLEEFFQLGYLTKQ